jgi:hypothetical protein
MMEVAYAGGPWTEDEQLKVDQVIDQPNFSRWMLYFMEDPQRISEYVIANCSTATVGGDSPIEKLQSDDFGFYLGTAFHLLHECADLPSWLCCRSGLVSILVELVLSSLVVVIVSGILSGAIFCYSLDFVDVPSLPCADVAWCKSSCKQHGYRLLGKDPQAVTLSLVTGKWEYEHIAPNSTFEVCKDTFGGADKFFQCDLPATFAIPQKNPTGGYKSRPRSLRTSVLSRICRVNNQVTMGCHTEITMQQSQDCIHGPFR